MHLAYTISEQRGELDLLLAEFAMFLTERGVKLAGMVQINTEQENSPRCDMDVRVLPDGPEIRISQSLGPEAKGCALNPEALSLAAAEASRHLAQGADLLIINKFGKAEAAGAGLRALYAEAMLLGTPILTGVNPLNLDALNAFTEGAAMKVQPSISSLLSWFEKTSFHSLEEIDAKIS